MFDKRFDAAVVEVEASCSVELSVMIAEGSEIARNYGDLVRYALGIVAKQPMLATEADEKQQRSIARFVIDDLFQLGPLEPALADPDITEIMVNGPQEVYVERRGELMLTDLHFFDDAHIEKIIARIVSADHRRCDQQSPMCDCTLHRVGFPFDGSRVNAVVRPIAVDHPVLNIRKFRNDVLTDASLIASGSLDENTRNLLRSLVIARMNIIVMGGTGTGKTTLLNMLSGYIPASQRIITVEDTTELKLQQEHWVRLESRQPNSEGAGEITIRQLVKNTLRQRPDRIVVGEVRGAEAFDLLQAMGSGHDGSLTTLHANDPRQSLNRLMMLVQQSEAGGNMPVSGIMQIITDAVDFIVHVKRFPDGSRRISEVTEVCGMQGDVPITAPIIKFHQTGVSDRGEIQGFFEPTGNRFCDKHRMSFANNGVQIDPKWFDSGKVW